MFYYKIFRQFYYFLYRTRLSRSYASGRSASTLLPAVIVSACAHELLSICNALQRSWFTTKGRTDLSSCLKSQLIADTKWVSRKIAMRLRIHYWSWSDYVADAASSSPLWWILSDVFEDPLLGITARFLLVGRGDSFDGDHFYVFRFHISTK